MLTNMQLARIDRVAGAVAAPSDGEDGAGSSAD